MREMDPQMFEHLVCTLFEKMGYAVTRTPYAGDNGSDGFLLKSGTRSVLQAKRVKGRVGEPILRDLFGTMHATQCAEAVVVTTGTVSEKARLWAKNKPIRIIELEELRDLINSHFSEDDIVPSNFMPASDR